MTNYDEIQLSDLLESYPPVTTPGFQTIITSKQEFAELTSSPIEKLPSGQGHFFKHQKFTHRFLREYDDLIILSQTGTGKSCEVLGFTEYVWREREKAKLDPTKADEKVAHLKRVVVLVKGPTQKNEFRNQLICKCSDGHYLSNIVKRSTKEAVQKTNLTLEIKKAGYIVSTYTSFARRIRQQYGKESNPDGDARLAEDYADTIFWIDEAHNLLIDPGVRATHREKQQTYHTLWRILHLSRRSKRIISTATPMINGVNEIGALLNLILPINGFLPQGYDYINAPPNDVRVLFPNLPKNFIRDGKIIPNTSPEQIAQYFNGQFPHNYDFNTATLLDLEPFFRGRVSYIRASDTGAVVTDVGIPQEGVYGINGVKFRTQLILYPTTMLEHQNNGYNLAKRIAGGRDELFGAERQAANFVFPDGYWANGITAEEREARREARRAREAVRNAVENAEEIETEELPEDGFLPVTTGKVIEEPITIEEEDGEIDIAEDVTAEATGYEKRAFRRYVTSRREPNRGVIYSPTPEFAPWLQDIGYIRHLSCKYAEICRLVLTKKGNAFIYGEYVAGSGAIVLSLCLEGLGFVRYNESTSMFLGTGGEVLKPYCGGNQRTTTNRRVRPDIQPGVLRYALLTRDTAESDARFNSMMEAMNSPENMNGDYIKVLISSRVGRDGINVSNITQIHLVGSEWNQSSIYQALSRGIRATSHDDLINEQKERIIAENGNIDDAIAYRRTQYENKHILTPEDQNNINIQINEIHNQNSNINETEISQYIKNIRDNIIYEKYPFTENELTDISNSVGNFELARDVIAKIVDDRHSDDTDYIESSDIRRDIIESRYLLTHEEKLEIATLEKGIPQYYRDIANVMNGKRQIIDENMPDLSRLLDSENITNQEIINFINQRKDYVSQYIPFLITLISVIERRKEYINRHINDLVNSIQSREILHNTIIDYIFRLSPQEEDQVIYENGDISKAKILVKIYRHAAVALDDRDHSIDLEMYRITEYKDRNIKRMMRFLKQCAIGCQVHYNRNVRPGDVDGSPTCDYDVCEYQCADPPPLERDYSTYDVLYSGELISEIIQKLVNIIYRQFNSLTLTDLSRYLPEYRTKYLIIALERLITNKTPLTDRFGYTTYLREDKGTFYLDRSYPTGNPSSYAMSYYTQGIIGIEQQSLANIVVKLDTGEYHEILNELEAVDPKDPQFDNLLEELNVEGKAIILEEIIIRALSGNKSELTDVVINKFKNVIFYIREPVTELNKVADIAAQKKPRRGRKRNPEIKRRIKKINPNAIDETKITRDDNTELVYLHTLYAQVVNQTGYAITARNNKAEGRLRLLKPSEIDAGWRDLNQNELPVYNAFLQIEIATRNREYEDRGIYGFILADGKFRIRDRLTEAPGAADDARKIKRGRVCEFWYRPDLIDIMWEIGVIEPGGIIPNFTEENRKQLITILLQKGVNKTYEDIYNWPLQRLIYYYKWYESRAKRDILCQLIRNRMAETGRLRT